MRQAGEAFTMLFVEALIPRYPCIY